MSEENKALMRRELEEVWNKHNPDAVDEIYAADFVNHSAMGIPATGKRITMTGITIARVAAGKITELWIESDQMGLMQQLGVVPAPGG
jgi:hypothetical protein